MRTTLAIIAALTLLGCGTEYDLSAMPEDGAGATAVSAAGAGRGNNVRTYTVDAAMSDRADYLFVVDSSVSMLKVLSKLRAGFESLGPDAFPRDARIAVMSTTPASMDRKRPHSTIGDVEGALKDPGFLHLIRGRDIAAWKGIEGAEAEQACGEGWFRPGDTLLDGTSCLQAITDLPLYKVNTEAGLVAVKQMLLNQGDEPLFRDGAAANIIFVSDTHDPGLPPGKGRDSLVSYRPDYFELVDLVSKANVVSSLKVHAIAPQVGCVDVEDWEGIGTAYYDVALASGGRIVDICATDNYRPILSDLAVYGATQTNGVFDLGENASEVLSVEINGTEVPWSSHRNGRLVRVDSKLPDGRADVRIITK